ncbi:MAG: acyl-CoA dehydrogenase family protein [Lachnospiraceae bacterium]|nr:acyl-CoA dehydrogenase family protein [Lachnospiraceae bacterium]
MKVFDMIQTTPEQKEILDLTKQICEKELLPRVPELDKEGTFPEDIAQKFVDAGLYAMEVPEQYGGMGIDNETLFLVAETLGYYDAGFGFTFHAGSMGAECVFVGGTEEQKQHAAEELLAGKKFAFCLTEPAVGSDAASIQTTAKKDGDEYVIRGNKCFISGAEIADYFVVATTIDKELKYKGITLFLVEKERGVQIAKHEDKMGIRLSPTNEVIFDDIRVPASNMIGAEGKGWGIVMRNMEVVRPHSMNFATGIAMRAVDEAVSYAKVRQQFGKPIISLQGLNFLLADMVEKTLVSHSALMNVAHLLDKGMPLNGMGSAVKIYASQTASYVASKSIEVLGGYGYMREYPVEKLLRDAKIFEIFEGTNQIQQVVLGSLLAKD